MHQLEHANDEEEIALAAIRNFGGRMPEFLKNSPRLQPGLELHYRAFWELTSCRQYGMGVGPIPWTAIKEWCEVNYTLDEPDFEYFSAVLRGLDAIYMKWVNVTKGNKNGDNSVPGASQPPPAAPRTVQAR